MDFAKKILSKYGWKEGDGLGKTNNGIAAPLKASLKFDNAGLGVDRATEFNDHWWERCFNDAASNVTVEVEQNGDVKTARKAGEEAVEISTKGYSARKLKKAKEQQGALGKTDYGNFLKSALLTQNGGEVTDSERIQVDDIAVTKLNVLTDEELFKACGGRTAHKGARHGLKLSGKLARLEQQEREMLEKLQGKHNAQAELRENTIKDKKLQNDECDEKELEEEKTTEEPEKNHVKRKKRKQKEEKEDISEEVEHNKIKKKKRKKDKQEEEINENSQDETEVPVKSKKKKNKHKHAE